MKRMAAAVAIASCVFAARAMFAQNNNPEPQCRMCPATYIDSSEVDAYVKKAMAEKLTDQQIRDVEIGKAHVGVGVVYRPRLTNTGKRAVHVKEVSLFRIAHDLSDETALYGESFQMLSQTAGTLASR